MVTLHSAVFRLIKKGGNASLAMPPNFTQLTREQRKTKLGFLFFQVSNGAVFCEALFCAGGFEAVAFATILAFAAMLSRLAVRITFAVVHVVTMHFVIRSNRNTAAAFRRVSCKCAQA
jgi:hypothetical protein